MKKKIKDQSIVELLDTLNAVSKKSNITPLYGKDNQFSENVYKWDKSCEIAWLMSPSGKSEALKLALENLVLTYDYKSVRDALDNLNVKIKRGA